MSDEEKNTNPTAQEVLQAWRDHLRDALRPLIVFIAMLVASVILITHIEQAAPHIGAIVLLLFGVMVLNNVIFISAARRSRQRFIDLKSSYNYHHPPKDKENDQ